jgi:hypothetical protein
MKKTIEVNISYVIAMFHLAISWLVIFYMLFNYDELPADWIWIWILFMIIDFPISLVLFNILQSLPYISVSFLPNPLNDARTFLIPALFHGIIGPIWYFFLSLFIIKFFKYIFDIFSVKK